MVRAWFIQAEKLMACQDLRTPRWFVHGVEFIYGLWAFPRVK